MSQITEKQAQQIRDRISRLAVPKEPIDTGFEARLSHTKQIQAVYVDVYGTILISGTEPMMRKNEDRNRMLLGQTYQSFGIDDSDEILNSSIRTLKSLIEESHREQKAEGTDHPEVDIIEIWEDLIAEVFGRYDPGELTKEQIPVLLTDFVSRYDEPWLMPGLEEMLTGLSERGIGTGIISNSQFYTPLTLEALSGKTMVELGFEERDCFWSYEEQIAKPSVFFYEKAARHLKDKYGLSAGEVLFVGNDMLNDVYPAREAGFITALFAGDKRSLRLREDDDRCAGLKPDMVITELVQILRLLP